MLRRLPSNQSRAPFSEAPSMKTNVQNQLIIFGVVVILIGLAFVGLGLHTLRKVDALRTRGVTLPAQITAASTDTNSKGKKRYILTVQWADGQATQTQRFAVKQDYFQTKVAGQNQVTAADTTITHIPGEPGTVIVEGGTTAFSGAHWGGALVLLIGALMMWKGCTGREAAPGRLQ